MAKATKTPKPRADKYEKPLVLKGTFEDLVRTAVRPKKTQEKKD